MGTPGAVAEAPRTYQETLQKLGMDTASYRRRPITHGWYMRGRTLAGGGWEPEPGLPSDVLVYLDMGDSYVREAYPNKGYRALSTVPNPRSMPGVNGDWVIRPPDLPVIEQAFAALAARRGEAAAATEMEIEGYRQQIKDGGLTGGEPRQLRRKISLLERRLAMLRDDRSFDPLPFYEAMVQERVDVLRSQQDPGQVMYAELQREIAGWEEHLRVVAGRAHAMDSTSGPAESRPSTRRGAVNSVA